MHRDGFDVRVVHCTAVEHAGKSRTYEDPRLASQQSSLRGHELVSIAAAHDSILPPPHAGEVARRLAAMPAADRVTPGR